MVMQEARNAFRSVVRGGHFSILAVVLLGVAAGGTGGLFSLFNTVVLRRLPVSSPHELVLFYPGIGEALLGIPMPTLAAIDEHQRTLQDVCGVVRGGDFEVQVKDNTSRRPVEAVTGKCFELLGVRMAMGRGVVEADAPFFGSSAQVVALTHRFWTTLGKPEDIVGRTLTVEGRQLEVIGITEPGFEGLNADEPPDIIVPLGVNAAIRGTKVPLALFGAGRLRDGLEITDAAGELRGLWPRVWAETNPTPAAARSPAAAASSLRVEPFDRGFSSLRSRYADPLLLIVALASLLLVLACVAASGLQLAKTISRGEELGTRMALGATIPRLSLMVSAEAVVVAAFSAAASLPIAWWVSRSIAVTLWTGSRPLAMRVTPDIGVSAAIVGTALLMGVLVSVPSVILIRIPQWYERNLCGRAVVIRRMISNRLLVVVQVAVSAVLLFAGAVFATNLQAIRTLDPGYDTYGLYWARLEPVDRRSGARADDADYLASVLERVSSLRQVSSATFSMAFPTTELRHVTALTPFAIEQQVDSGDAVRGRVDSVWPGFFRATGIRVVRGRDFTVHDDEDQPAVAVINTTMAQRLFGEADPIGQTVRVGSAQRAVTVVGVADTVSPGDFRIRDSPTMYRPLMQDPRSMSSPLLLIRVREGDNLLADLRNAIGTLGRHHVTSLRNSSEQMNRFLLRERMLAGLSAAFACLGLLVSGVGLYSLLAYTVARRTRETGLRMALGAHQTRLFGAIVAEGVTLVTVGLALGSPAAVALFRRAAPLLFETATVHASTIAFTLVGVLAVGTLASMVPAFRIIRVRPADALRCE